MQVNDERLVVNVDLNIKEIRLIHYALRQLRDDGNLDLMLGEADIENVIRSFSEILNSNFVAEIKKEDVKNVPDVQ